MGLIDKALGKASELERRLQEKVRELLGRPGEGPQLLEVKQAILDEVESKVQPVGDGQHVFAFDRLIVRLRAANASERYLYESAFVEGGGLRAQVAERLAHAGCAPSPGLSVEFEFVENAGEEWAEKGFTVEYERQGGTRDGRATARLVVVRGKAGRKTFTVNKARFNVGRTDEIKDKRGLVVRRNDLFFLDKDDELNQSVSRVHAHIFLDEREGGYRLRDDGSSHGTRVFRDGRTIMVPPEGQRGVRLRDGDEIYFGKTLVRFEAGD